MRYIQQVIETVTDETGIAPQIEITFNHLGWNARVCDDGITLLCSAGERFLNARSCLTPALAIAELEEIAKTGYALSKSWLKD